MSEERFPHRSDFPFPTDVREADASLIEAVWRGSELAVRSALALGADPSFADPRPFVGELNTPLHLSVDHPELVALLLASGANVNARDSSGWTPLMRACNAGAFEVALMMLEHGAEPHARNDEGYTAWGRIPGNCTRLLALFRERGLTNSRE